MPSSAHRFRLARFFSATRLPALQVALIGVLLMGACTVGPDYVQPLAPTPDLWSAAVAGELSKEEPDIERWWTALGDSVLTELIRRAEISSLDVAAAVARVREARAIRGIATGDNLPSLTLSGAYSRTRISENSPQFPAEGEPGEGENGDGAVFDNPSDFWSVGFDMSWEIDLFGRIRRQVEAATAEFQASIEDYRDVLVTLYAEVAASYIDVRSSQARIAFALSNAEGQSRSLQLTRDRFLAGLTSALDVSQAESNLANTEAAIPSLEIQLTFAKNRLAVLLGEPPGTLDDLLDEPAPIPDPSEKITVGMPGDLLRRRPDIRRAERRLAAQTARVGVATADLYPSFSILGFFGLESIDFSDLGKSASIAWGIIPGFSWNLFEGGKIRNRIKVEYARTDQVLVAYELAVLVALEEVENSLIAYARERIRRDRLSDAANASQRSVDLVRTQYLSGLTNFQNVLDTQRFLFQQQDELAASEGQVVLNLISLNKALGGGWALDEPTAERLSARPAQEDGRP